jgi:hypothetical protein
MANQYKPRGALFKNNKKEKESHPDYVGDLELNGELLADINAQLTSGIERPKIRLSGWKKEGPTAGVYLSLSPSKFEVNVKKSPMGENQAKPMPTAARVVDDEIPF